MVANFREHSFIISNIAEKPKESKKLFFDDKNNKLFLSFTFWLFKEHIAENAKSVFGDESNNTFIILLSNAITDDTYIIR